MGQINILPESVRLVGNNMSGMKEEAEYKARTAPQQIQAKVKALLKNSPSFDSLSDAVKQAKEDFDRGEWSHVVAPWDDNSEKFWVVRENDPNYKYVCFSGLRFVVPAATVDTAWKVLTTDTIEEI